MEIHRFQYMDWIRNQQDAQKSIVSLDLPLYSNSNFINNNCSSFPIKVSIEFFLLETDW